VFVDYNQNARDRTVASAYSVRALPDARFRVPSLGKNSKRWSPLPYASTPCRSDCAVWRSLR